jgi:hypothetical protein
MRLFLVFHPSLSTYFLIAHKESIVIISGSSFGQQLAQELWTDWTQNSDGALHGTNKVKQIFFFGGGRSGRRGARPTLHYTTLHYTTLHCTCLKTPSFPANLLIYLRHLLCLPHIRHGWYQRLTTFFANRFFLLLRWGIWLCYRHTNTQAYKYKNIKTHKHT